MMLVNHPISPLTLHIVKRHVIIHNLLITLSWLVDCLWCTQLMTHLARVLQGQAQHCCITVMWQI